MSGTLSRRAALRGSAAAALSLAVGVTPALAVVAPFHPEQIGVVADASLIEFAGRISTLALRRHATFARADRLQTQVDAIHPHPPMPVTNAVYHAYYAETRPTEDRIGLTLLRKVGRRMAERQDRWASDLAAMEPSSSAGLGAKAEAVLAIDDLAGEAEGAERLLLSLLRDAVRLGGGVHA